MYDEISRVNRAIDSLQVTGTTAGIAVALAAIVREEGPTIERIGTGFHIVPVLFLIAGFLAIVGAMFSIQELAAEEQMSLSNFLDFRPNGYLATEGKTSLSCIAFALMILVVAYFAFLISLAH